MRDCCVEQIEHWGKNWKYDEETSDFREIRIEPDTNRAEGDQLNTELLMSQSSDLYFLHIMLLSFEIGFLVVWFSRRSKSARSYLHSRCANRGSQTLRPERGQEKFSFLCSAEHEQDW